MYGDDNRTLESIKRNFSSLHQCRILTGYPKMLEFVCNAKQMRYLITERTDVRDGT